eukprot:1370924-Rhodomonas_salina.1
MVPPRLPLPLPAASHLRVAVTGRAEAVTLLPAPLVLGPAARQASPLRLSSRARRRPGRAGGGGGDRAAGRGGDGSGEGDRDQRAAALLRAQQTDPPRRQRHPGPHAPLFPHTHTPHTPHTPQPPAHTHLPACVCV